MKLFTRTDSKTTKLTWQIFKEEMSKDRRSFITSVTFISISTFLYLVVLPLLTSFVIQILVEDTHNSTALAWLIGGMIAASILSIILNKAGFDMIFRHEERVTTNLLDRAMKALLSHSQGYFANQKVGSLANDVSGFSRSYMSLVDIIMLQLNGILISYVTSLIVIAFISPILLLPLTLLTGFIVWHSIASMKQRAPLRNKRKELNSRLLGQLADILGNQALIRLFGQTSRELSTVRSERNAIMNVAVKEIGLIQSNAQTRQLVLFTVQIIIVVLIIFLLQNSMIGIGAVIFSITYLARVTSTMYNINGIIRGAEQAFLDAAKVTDMLQLEPEVVDVPNAAILKVEKGLIELKDISFAYADAKKDIVIDSLNLTILPGQKIGLVGKSGGGKTTLTSLVLRYADVTDGEIKIDDQNISNVTQDSLRNAISYVPQDPYLFHRSLRENISYGKIDATDEEIIHAAEQANAWEFISQLPAKLNTIVGERGVKLSGGQRQRIAIARAILKDAPILVLDEATSALDSESEKLIQKSLESLMQGRTSIVIAHRLSTIAKLDRIVVLDKGKIIEDGTHAELIARNGTYAKLWNHQSGGFIDE